MRRTHRLVQRRVELQLGPHRQLLLQLRDALCGWQAGRAQAAVAVHQVGGPYPAVAQMGHDYVNNETHMVAAALASDARLAEKMVGAGFDPVRPRSLLGAAADRLAHASGFDVRLVDWSEVATEFMTDEQLLGQSARQPAESVPRVAAPEHVQPTAVLDTRRIEADVLEVLARCVAEEHLVRLPPGRMTRDLYGRVNNVLTALGGRWKGGKVQAHVFEQEASPILEVAVATGGYLKPQDFGYFPTPAELVRQLIELAELRAGMTVLEPSAGRGAIALPAAEIVGRENVTVVELLASNVGHLARSGFHRFVMQDFLELQPSEGTLFDRVIMNPPFSRLAAVDHVLHASKFLRPDGRLLAITSPSWEHNSSRKAAAFREFFQDVDGHAIEVPAGAFRESGTDVATRILVMEAENFPWNQTERLRERQRA